MTEHVQLHVYSLDSVGQQWDKPGMHVHVLYAHVCEHVFIVTVYALASDLKYCILYSGAGCCGVKCLHTQLASVWVRMFAVHKLSSSCPILLSSDGKQVSRVQCTQGYMSVCIPWAVTFPLDMDVTRVQVL